MYIAWACFRNDFFDLLTVIAPSKFYRRKKLNLPNIKYNKINAILLVDENKWLFNT